MRLDLVCTMFLRYTPRFPKDTRLAAVMPGHGVGAGYGEGTGNAVGDRLSGQLYWSNRPTVRSDNIVFGDFYGILLPDDGTYIVFSMRGYVVPWPGEPHILSVKRDGIFGVTFQADHPDYHWVNTTYFVAESTISAEHTVEVRVFSCTNEIGPHVRKVIEGNEGTPGAAGRLRGRAERMDRLGLDCFRQEEREISWAAQKWRVRCCYRQRLHTEPRNM